MGKQNLEDTRQKLPAWSFHEEAARTNCKCAICMAPMIPLLRAAAIGSIVFQVALFCVGHRVVAHPTLFAFTVMVLVAARAFVECSAMRHRLPNYVVHASFQVGGWAVPFQSWFNLMFVMSQISFFDIMFDTFFTNSAMRLLERDQTTSKIWTQVWENSLLCWLPAPSLWLLLVSWWSLSLLQMVIPVFKSIRHSDLQLKTVHQFRHVGLSQSLGGNLVDHGGVSNALAGASGMMLVTSTLLPYMKGVVADPARSTSDKTRGMVVVAHEMLSRVFFSGLFENAAQLNLQSTLYAIRVAVSRQTNEKNGLQITVLLSLSLTLVTTLLKLFEAYDFFILASASEELASRGDACEDAKCNNTTTQQKAKIIRLGCAALCLSLAYAAAKVCMSHICEDAVWNISGCVRLQA